MKKLLFFILSGIVAFSSCKKKGDEANPFSDVKNLGVGSYLILNKVIGKNIDFTNFNASQVGIEVDRYPGGEEVDRIEIYVVKGASVDASKWKKVKTVTFTGPNTKLTVTGAEMATAFGLTPADFPPGSSYTFYNRLFTKSGKAYDVTNTGNNGGSGLITGSYYSSAFTFSAFVICAWTQASTDGTVWTIDEDGWEDFAPGSQFTMQNGPGANQVTMVGVYPTSYMHKDVVLDINPATGEVTIAKQAYGGYSNGGTIYSAEGSGYIFSCSDKLDLSVTHTSPGSNFGAFKFVAHR
ncbi:MAG TPA: hypothetical protein VFN30_10890 [Chitinophagaceae bacterium]|nr:hypothetical protein [Chitinophagaceae bacterium]